VAVLKVSMMMMTLYQTTDKKSRDGELRASRAGKANWPGKRVQFEQCRMYRKIDNLHFSNAQ
jgi:hypothetical protein